MGFNANCGKMQCRAGDARAAGWEGHYSFFVAALPIYCLRILDVTPGYLNRLAASPRQ